jgi:SAM-dependent methyltransferase
VDRLTGPSASQVDPLARRGFERAADDYERGRPGYPAEAVEMACEKLSIGPSSVVLDLAAGTGKLSEALLGTGARIIAVEPLDAMRERLTEALPAVEALAGSAEAIPLADGSVDAALVGQAFHWFHGGRALAELHRVLRPPGGLALLWNGLDMGVDWVAQMYAAIEPHRGDAPCWRAGAWRAAFERTTLFGPLEEARFRHVQPLTPEGLKARFTSISFVSVLADDERRRVLERVLRVAEGRHPNGAIALPYETQLNWCRRTQTDRSL